MKQHFWILIDI